MFEKIYMCRGVNMRTREMIMLDLDAKNEAISNAQNKIEELKEKIKVNTATRDEMIKNNTVAAEREKKEILRNGLKLFGKICVFGPLVLDVVLFVALIVFESAIERAINGDALQLQLTILAIPLALIIPGIILWILSALPKKKIAELSAQLVEFDKEKLPFERAITFCTSELEKQKEIIEKAKEKKADCELELKYAQYAKDHVMIFVAEKGSSDDDLRSIKHNIVVDNIDYGSAIAPFKAIKLSSGIHAIRVDVGVYINGTLKVYSSDVTQVEVNEDRVFIKYVFKGPGMPFFAQKYYDAPEFFKATNQKP
jgi:hypothetical protein